MSRYALFALIIVFAIAPGSALAQHTFSFQGLLTDTSGDPVADNTYSTTFKLYTVPTAGSAIWTEVQSLLTSGGIYNVQLGSVTPFSGIDFTQPLWLGITVAPDVDEMTDRTPLGGVPSALALALPFSGSADTPESAVQIVNAGGGNAVYGVNTGDGTAGAFVVDSETNTNTGVYGQTNGTGSAVYGRNVGTGTAGRFRIDNPSSDAAALFVETNGTGMGILSDDTVYVRTADLGLTSASRVNEDVIVEAFDALIGLYSDGAGSFGSGLQFGEMDGFGTLVDKWGIVRRTFSAPGDDKSALVLTYGTDRSYGVNAIQFQLTNDGRALLPNGYIKADSVIYNNPKTGYASISGGTFVPTEVVSGTEWSGTNAGFRFTAGTVSGALGSIQLPHGATVQSLTCTIKDNSSLNLQCILCRGSETGCLALGSVESSNASTTFEPYSTATSASVVDNANYSYYIAAYPTSGTWSTEGANLIIGTVSVEYTLPGAP